jgi:subtilase family serine protease
MQQRHVAGRHRWTGWAAPLLALASAAAAGPDLVVSLLHVTPDPATAGQSVTIDTTVQNQGDAASGDSHVHVWRHRVTPPPVTAVGDYLHDIDPLGAGATRAFIDTFTPVYAGDRTAWAYADTGDFVTEDDEENNVASQQYSINPSGADLAFQAFNVIPDPVALGQQATINATIINQGTDAAPSCLLQLWRHRAGPPVIGTTGDFTHAVGALGPTATQAFASQFYPHYQGARAAWGLVDSQNIVAEQDETNNKASYQYNIGPGETPDLVCDATATPNPVGLGNAVTLTVDVDNTGDAAAAAFTLAAWRHWPGPPVIGSPPEQTWAIAGLAVGASVQRTFTFTPQYTGPRTAWAFADNANVAIENNEANNIAFDEYAIVLGSEPDLVAAVSVWREVTVLDEQRIMTVTVENPGPSSAGPFALAAWLHRDTPPGPGSPPDLSWTLPGLAAGATATRTHDFTPGSLGERTAWAFADTGQTIVETNEDNNIASFLYETVEPPPPPPPPPPPVTSAAAAPTRGGQVAFSYALSAPADIELHVRNMAGRTVARMNVGPREPGSHTEIWSAAAAAGGRVPAGLYVCEIVARTDTGQQARAVAPVRLGR